MNTNDGPTQDRSDFKERPDWDVYFLTMAQTVATRSTCVRRSVGAVLVRDRRVLATGYNGAPRGLPHCYAVGCELEHGHCVRAVHAEVNAVVQAALHGVSTEGAMLYCTSQPCYACAKLVVNAGVVRVVDREAYEDPRSLALFAAAGVERVTLAAAAAAAASMTGGPVR